MRIAGVRISPEYARLLLGSVERAGFHETAARLGQALEQGVTTEAPLTIEDHEAVLAVLRGECPPGLYRLRTELDKDHRLRRGIAGG